jgi:signal transduction histidine kinase/CheY-like chemotaxis protein
MRIGFSIIGVGIMGILASVFLYGRQIPSNLIPQILVLSFSVLLLGFGLCHSQLMALVNRVRKSEEKIQQKNHELKQINKQFQKASESKSAFLANMSHELRTPLNAIIGFSEVLKDLAFGELNQKQLKYVGNIYSSGKHLLSLINDILDLSKIESGKLELQIDGFSIPETIEGIIATVKGLASKKGITLDLQTNRDLPYMTADHKKFKQILYNLLSNAIKFTPDGGKVSLTANASTTDSRIPENFIHFTVEDSGIGIAPENQDQVFAAFEQIDDSYSRQQEGTGLGLALTKKLVEMHGGEIWFESEVGKGTAFHFSLPCNFEQFQESEKSQDITEENAVEDKKEEGIGDGPLVLVVEDDPKARELLSIHLSDAGYQLAYAVDGEEALKKAKELRPAVITLDIMLPKKDGWQVLMELKQMPETQNIPVIIVSIVADDTLASSLEAMDCLVKPFSKQQLLEKLQNVRFNHQNNDKRIKVLVIDDDQEAVELFALFLEGKGFDIDRAYSGKQGIKQAITGNPDLIILDLMMPKMNGFEVIKALKDHPASKKIPVIINTSLDITREEIKELNGKIHSLVEKGISSKTTLLAEIRKIEKKQVNTERRIDHGHSENIGC